MRPSLAASPMELRVFPHPLVHNEDFEDISLPPSHLASAFQPLPELTVLAADPFEGSALSGFSLPAVGSALATRPAGDAPAEKELSL